MKRRTIVADAAVIVAVFVVTHDFLQLSTLPDEVAHGKHLLGAEVFSPYNRFTEKNERSTHWLLLSFGTAGQRL